LIMKLKLEITGTGIYKMTGLIIATQVNSNPQSMLKNKSP